MVSWRSKTTRRKVEEASIEREATVCPRSLSQPGGLERLRCK